MVEGVTVDELLPIYEGMRRAADMHHQARTYHLFKRQDAEAVGLRAGSRNKLQRELRQIRLREAQAVAFLTTGKRARDGKRETRD